MAKTSFVPENIKDPKYREYFDHLHEIIERQNREIKFKNQLLQIQNLNFQQELVDLIGELLTFLWDDQFNSIRVNVKKKENQKEELLYSGGIGNKSSSYGYLDNQIEEQLGDPGILYISDTSKIHSIKFTPGDDYPKTILGMSLGEATESQGFLWFACANQKNFTKHESDFLFSLIDASSAIIKNCVNWNERTKTLSFQREVFDQIDHPVLLFTQNTILFSNTSARKIFNQILEDSTESELFLNKLWKLPIANKSFISLNNSDYGVTMIDDEYFSSQKTRAAFFTDETLLKKQQFYLSVVLNSISQGLRSTLILILGSIKMLPLVGEVNVHQKEYIDGVKLKAEESLTFIDDLLQVERVVESNGLKLNYESIKKVVDNSLLLVDHLAKQKQISIRNEISNSNEFVHLDCVLFTQMLANLLEFAIGLSNLRGEISIETDNASQGRSILIKDNSNGLSKVEVDRLNLSNNPDEIPQTLRLAKKIISFHGGTFILQSDLGKGNKYLIQLPK